MSDRVRRIFFLVLSFVVMSLAAFAKNTTTCPACGARIRDGENCPNCGPVVGDDRSRDKSKKGDKKKTVPKSGKK